MPVRPHNLAPMCRFCCSGPVGSLLQKRKERKNKKQKASKKWDVVKHMLWKYTYDKHTTHHICRNRLSTCRIPGITRQWFLCVWTRHKGTTVFFLLILVFRLNIIKKISRKIFELLWAGMQRCQFNALLFWRILRFLLLIKNPSAPRGWNYLRRIADPIFIFKKLRLICPPAGQPTGAQQVG